MPRPDVHENPTFVCQTVIDVAVMTANMFPERDTRKASNGSFSGIWFSSLPGDPGSGRLEG